MKHDLRAVGITAGTARARVAASATRGYAGEPLMTTPTYTTGVSDVNTVVVVTNDKPTIGTDEFKGLCSKDFEVDTAAAVIAHYTELTMFIPYATKVRGKAETVANLDTQSELTGLLYDLTRFHLASSTYRIQAPGEADTGGLQIVDGNIAKGTLDCVVDARAMRTDVTA